MNKAVRLEEKDTKGDKNPKDFIVFFASDFTVISTRKDNTGEMKYVENMVFQTLSFPSDHGVTSTILVEEIAVGSTRIEQSVSTLEDPDEDKASISSKGKHRLRSTGII